jgi:hypothetical protein
MWVCDIYIIGSNLVQYRNLRHFCEHFLVCKKIAELVYESSSVYVFTTVVHFKVLRNFWGSIFMC